MPRSGTHGSVLTGHSAHWQNVHRDACRFFHLTRYASWIVRGPAILSAHYPLVYFSTEKTNEMHGDGPGHGGPPGPATVHSLCQLTNCDSEI